MTKVAYRVVEPQQKSGSFGAEPKILYRASNRYSRIEEGYDPKEKIKLLFIVNEPDFWMVDLISKKGRHGVDPGPTFNVRVPVFTLDHRKYKEVSQLEFGHEQEFFAQHFARPVKVLLSGKSAKKYELILDETFHVTLWTSETDKPIRIRGNDGSHQMTFEYVTYETELPFAAELFDPPPGIELTEAEKK